MSFQKVITGNYFDKHTSTNLFYKVLISRYRNALQRVIVNTPFTNVLEVGSGEGHIISYIKAVKKDISYIASDIDLQLIKNSKFAHPQAEHVVCVGEKTPFVSKSYDLVLACEVLEHVRDPRVVMQEISRVGRRWFIASVPYEPWWRILNMIRLKYLRLFGNTPGHIQHWGMRSFKNFIGEYCEISQTFSVFPWIFIIGEFKTDRNTS